MRAFALAALVAAAALGGCARSPSIAEPQAAGASATAATSASASTSNEAVLAARPPAAPSPTGIPGRTKPAPPMSKPLPPQEVPASGNAPKLDTSCRSDSDCAVKNVGSCCGAKPACVNKDAKVDPAAVQADCAARGLASVCGFEDVQSCTCAAGTCRGGASSPVTQ
jgi:hypothetical protein